MSTSTTDVRQFDTGTKLKITVLENGVPVDISSATLVMMKFRKKDKTILEVVADFDTDGTDGVIVYTSGSADFDISGEWKMQAYLETPLGHWHTDIQQLTVGEIIDA